MRATYKKHEINNREENPNLHEEEAQSTETTNYLAKETGVNYEPHQFQKHHNTK